MGPPPAGNRESAAWGAGDRPAADDLCRLHVRVEGTVQGVGFRPYVYRLARELALGGWVRNDARGVVVEVEGTTETVRRFLNRLPREIPPLASVERVESQERSAEGSLSFEIIASEGGASPSALVSPDTATCNDCLRELFDRLDRRYRYPFINCTNCGPRFTIIKGIPYDRPQTTMSAFTMCEACRREYEDPEDRRFHAQPNACPRCGPRVVLHHADGTPAEGSEAPAGDPVTAAATAILEGAIVAVKGLGGFHLACRADDEAAVARLRSRKHREDKPFAVMVPSLDAALELAPLQDEEVRLLTAKERPIVIAPRREGTGLAPAVAPDHRDLGIMLPYTPLHHLLLSDTGVPLVMTSGNVSDEPIAFRNAEALERLAAIADLFLLHDRPIETRTEDSVIRVVTVRGERRPMMVRRSRGYVPSPTTLATPAPAPILACGGHLKNTFALARERRLWAGPHMGDLENLETLLSFEEGVRHLERLFEVEPAIIAHDLHPDYLSTKYAMNRAKGGPRLLAVQHHHAHLAGVLSEHGERGPAIGAIYDGTGYGTDGTVWGGEILVGDLSGFERAGHLWPVRLPGGAAAIRQPWRMACAWLAALEGGVPSLPALMADQISGSDWEKVARLTLSGLASPQTTSMGRLFDAVSALCALRMEVTYEGQAAIELEMAAAEWASLTAHAGPADAYPLPSERGPAGIRVLDARPTLRAVMRDLAEGSPAGLVSARFHEAVAVGTAEACRAEALARGLETVVLSGGVFQNLRLLERTANLLAEAGLRPLLPERFPANDGGLAYGQAVVAAAHS